MAYDVGVGLKDSTTVYWNSPNTGATNSSCFTALPGSYYGYSIEAFYYINQYLYFCTSKDDSGGTFGSTYAWFRTLRFDGTTVYRHGNQQKIDALYIRCLKN